MLCLAIYFVLAIVSIPVAYKVWLNDQKLGDEEPIDFCILCFAIVISSLFWPLFLIVGAVVWCSVRISASAIRIARKLNI